MSQHNKHRIPTLESLVNRCCEDYCSRLDESLDVKAPDPNNNGDYFSYTRFRDFIDTSHCQENLRFLIEIYHYERIWNRVFKRQSSILKCKEDPSRKPSVATINNSAGTDRKEFFKLTPILKDQNHSTTPNSDSQPITTSHETETSSPTLVEREVNELALPKVLKTSDDIDTNSFIDQELSSKVTSRLRSQSMNNHEAWNNLFKSSYFDPEKECSCDKSYDTYCCESDRIEELSSPANLREQLKEKLTEKFNYIITHYVLNSSPFEINLPDPVYRDLVAEYKNTEILYHSPLTLLPARNAVLQLLRENIYYKFLKNQEELVAKEDEIKTRELKVTEPQSAASIKSQATAESEDFNKCDKSDNAESLASIDRSTTQGGSISTFLNKYHIKLHHSTSSSSLSTDPPTEDSQSSNTTQPKVAYKHLHSNHHQGDNSYMKGPCGIEPDADAYNPKPPMLKKGWSAKLGLRFRSHKS